MSGKSLMIAKQMKFDINQVKEIARSRFKVGEAFLVYLQEFRGYLFRKEEGAELRLIGIKRKAKGYPIRVCEGTPVIIYDGKTYECKASSDILFISKERANWEKAEARRYRRLSQEEILSYRERYPL